MNDAGDPYLICALGRSRSTWLAELLTYRTWTCDHDRSIYMRSVADVAAFFARPHHGSAETAASPGWELIRHLAPNLRTVVIRRPVNDVVAAFLAVDLRGMAIYDAPALRRNIERLDRAQDRIARQPGVLVLDFADLVHEDACQAVWHHCLPYAWDRRWWLALRDRNVQCDTVAQVLYYHRNTAEIDAF